MDPLYALLLMRLWVILHVNYGGTQNNVSSYLLDYRINIRFHPWLKQPTFLQLILIRISIFFWFLNGANKI